MMMPYTYMRKTDLPIRVIKQNAYTYQKIVQVRISHHSGKPSIILFYPHFTVIGGMSGQYRMILSSGNAKCS